MSRSKFVVLWALSAALGGCSTKDGGTVTGADAPADLQRAPMEAKQAGSDANAMAAYWASQKLIRTADVRIDVDNVDEASGRADSIARAMGAVVAERRTSRDDRGRHSARLELRVPTEQLDNALGAVRRLGDVQEEAVATQNVTREYADLETRLAVKDETIARLRALIANRTATLGDVLEVERELARAVAELEELKGQRRYYDQQIAMSTIRLGLVERGGASGMQLTGPVRTALAGSLDVMGRSVALVISLVVFLLPWAAVGAPLWWLARRWRTRAT